MITQADQDRIAQLHKLYEENTGQQVPLSMSRICQWEVLLTSIKHYDCTPEKAVILVATWLKKNKDGRFRAMALRFRSFVDPETFQEALSGALSDGRKPKVSRGYWEVMKSTGRTAEPPSQKAKRLDEVVASSAFKELMKLRDDLKG